MKVKFKAYQKLLDLDFVREEEYETELLHKFKLSLKIELFTLWVFIFTELDFFPFLKRLFLKE